MRKTRASLRTTIESRLETHELEETTRTTYVGYAAKHIYPVIGDEPIGAVTAHVLERFYAALRRCSERCDGRPYVEHRVDGPHECREVRHKRPPGRPPASGYPPHDCTEKGCVVVECAPHVCRPLAAAKVRKIHFIIRGAMSAALRWGWITSNLRTAAELLADAASRVPTTRSARTTSPTPSTATGHCCDVPADLVDRARWEGAVGRVATLGGDADISERRLGCSPIDPGTNRHPRR